MAIRTTRKNKKTSISKPKAKPAGKVVKSASLKNKRSKLRKTTAKKATVKK